MRENTELSRALGLTAVSALVWGVAHLWSGRTRTGLTLAAIWVMLLAAAVTVFFGFRGPMVGQLLQTGRLTGVMFAAALLALIWAGVIVSSWRVVRPRGLTGTRNIASTGLVGVMCALAVAPMAYASRLAYVSQDLVSTVFTQEERPPRVAGPTGGVQEEADPWDGRERVGFLLLGVDSARNRHGARTDSMTVASVDTRSGRTVLFSLPRNLENVPLPAGPARDAFPFGFTGAGDENNPGLLNEVYQWAEDNPSIVPGVPDGKRGITLLKNTVAGILGLPIDYYAMVDMQGFAQIIDAMGGVTITVKQDIVFGRYREGTVRAGTRKLSGEEALWFGRSRTDSDDYTRMSRQKCLLNAVARQADPLTVLRGFDEIADATKRYISTDLPQRLLPALLTLSDKVKGAQIQSLQFVPPLISTVTPDWNLIRAKVSAELAAQRSATITRDDPSRVPRPSPPPEEAIALDVACS